MISDVPSEAPLSILMVSDDFLPNPGGIAAHVYELARALGRRGHEVDLWAGHNAVFRHGPKPACEPSVALVRNMPFTWNLCGRMRVSWNTATGLRRRIARKRYDVAHWHSLFYESLAMRVGARKVPRVFTNHSSGFLKASEFRLGRAWYLPYLLQPADAIITPSTQLQEATVRIGYDASRVGTIPNGVDVDDFCPGPRPTELAARYGLGPDARVAVVPRRLVHKNGVDLLVRAMAEPALSKLVVLLVGDGPERGALERLARELGVADRVRFAGSQPRASMVEHLRLADVGVLPSRMEAISLAGLEMMATGLPVVGTRVGGIPEFITDPDTGRLVEPESPVDLARGLSELLALSPEQRQQMGAAGRTWVEQNFSWDVCAQRVESVYRRVARQR